MTYLLCRLCLHYLNALLKNLSNQKHAQTEETVQKRCCNDVFHFAPVVSVCSVNGFRQRHLFVPLLK
jgi:hypothetical protein